MTGLSLNHPYVPGEAKRLPPPQRPSASAAAVATLSDYDRLRYTDPVATTIFPREFFYQLLAPLHGKSTLHIGLGDGLDACLCALNGASVCGFDASETRIAQTERRLKANGLTRGVRIAQSDNLDEAFEGEVFDAIVAYDVLHRLPIKGLAEKLHARLRPGGVAAFCGRVPSGGTVRRLAKPFSRVVWRRFGLTTRLQAVAPDNYPLSVALHHLDGALLKCPPLRLLTGTAVFGLYRRRD